MDSARTRMARRTFFLVTGVLDLVTTSIVGVSSQRESPR